MGFVEPVVLTGRQWVSLEPLTEDHVPEISEAAADGDPGRLWFTSAPSPATAEQWVQARVAAQRQSRSGRVLAAPMLVGARVGRPDSAQGSDGG